MADKLKGKPGFAGWRHAVWVFIKAQLSSYVASLIDFLVTILLVKLSGLFYLYATFLGSVVGGVVNCVINYGWVFHEDDCKKTHVALKYLFVWGGSILLNTWGTFKRCVYPVQDYRSYPGGVLLELSSATGIRIS